MFDAVNYVNDSNNSFRGESTEGGSGLLPAGSYYYVITYQVAGENKTATGWLYINY